MIILTEKNEPRLHSSVPNCFGATIRYKIKVTEITVGYISWFPENSTWAMEINNGVCMSQEFQSKIWKQFLGD